MTGEDRGRILLQGGIGGLLVLTLAPLFLPELGGALAPLLEKCQELLAQCLLALRAAGASLYWLPVSLLAGGAVYAGADRVRVWRRLTRLLAFHSIRPPDPDEPIGRLAREFGHEGRVHVLMDLAPNPAFTAGVLRPHIYLAEELQQNLAAPELRAVFRHEACHLRRRDPLRFAVLRFLSKTFFWLPLLGVWVEELMEETEIVADDFAAARDGGVDPLDVANALVILGRRDQPALVAAASIGGFRLLDRRVRRLAGVPTGRPPRLPGGAVMVSAIALAIFWISLLLHPPLAHAAPIVRADGSCPHHMHASPERHCPRCHRTPPPLRACGGMSGSETSSVPGAR